MEQSGAETMGSKLGTHVLGKNDGEYNSGPMFNAWGGAETTGSKTQDPRFGQRKNGEYNSGPVFNAWSGAGQKQWGI